MKHRNKKYKKTKNNWIKCRLLYENSHTWIKRNVNKMQTISCNVNLNIDNTFKQLAIILVRAEFPFTLNGALRDKLNSIQIQFIATWLNRICAKNMHNYVREMWEKGERKSLKEMLKKCAKDYAIGYIRNWN